VGCGPPGEKRGQERKGLGRENREKEGEMRG